MIAIISGVGRLLYMAGFLVISLLLFGFIAATSLRIVPQGEVALKERFGRPAGTLNPGLHFIVPFIDRTMRQKEGPETNSFEFGKVKAEITYSVKDAALLRQNVADFPSALKIGAEARLKKLLNDDLSNVSIMDLAPIEEDFFSDLLDLFKPWGVEIEKAALKIL
jgi:regulator of protease activity HflC (stomatin/prohibitin superfamily)